MGLFHVRDPMYPIRPWQWVKLDGLAGFNIGW